MEIHQDSFDALLRELPQCVNEIIGLGGSVHIDSDASICDGDCSRRHVSRHECVVGMYTHSVQVILTRAAQSPMLLFELPLMVDGEFVIKGRHRLIMLRKRRATAPVRIGDSLTVMGAKYNPVTGQIMIPGARQWSSVRNVSAWNSVDPSEYLSYCDAKGYSCAWNNSDMAITRIQTPGVLLKVLLLPLLRREVSHHARRGGTWRHESVTRALESALATGNWRNGCVGVTQLRNYNNNVSSVAQFRTVVGSNGDADRYVHPSTWCYYCVSETPEGEKCGLVHHLTDNVRITEESNVPAPPRCEVGAMYLFWNGIPHGRTDKAPAGVSCVTRDDEIWAWTDAGRVEHVRPVDPKRDMLGHAASLIPFAQHNQSPRVSYYSAMSKQAMQLPVPDRPTKHVLCYAQESLVSPRSVAGINVVIAILPLGYNIEDALVFSKGAIDRGLFRSLCNTVSFMEPGESVPRIGDQIHSGTVVDVTFNGELYTVTSQRMRIPELGDKFASRAGQKGTIGMICPQEDLPFNADGISPDVVINPHAFPSRMTVSQIYETAFGLLATVGVKVDARPFAPLPPVQDLLQEHGWCRSGKEMMINGKTGEPLEARVFMGLCFYQRLHHLSQEKCYARRGGPVDDVTMQPVAGRKRGGGLRLGEMEKDCIHSSGALGVLQERMGSIGKSVVPVCRICSQPTTSCGHSNNDSVFITMPHASKLLLMELQSMLVKVKVT